MDEYVEIDLANMSKEEIEALMDAGEDVIFFAVEED
jgi:hypothetical protein